MPYKILILESVRDDDACRRELLVHQIPSLREHHFEHMYLSDRPPLDQTQPLPARLLQTQQNPLDEQALLGRIKERVSTFQADILLVHSGALFYSHPEQMLFILQTLKAAYPDLRMGFKPRPFERYGSKPFFEYTVEMRDLIRKVFAERSG